MRAPLSRDAINEMHRPSFYSAKYVGKGVAWATAENESGDLLVVEHDGGGSGMRAELQLYPQEDLAIAILVNSDTRQFHNIRHIILNELKPGFSDYLIKLYEIPLESKDRAIDKASAKTTSQEEHQLLWLETAKTYAGKWDANIEGPLGNNKINIEIRNSGEVYVGFDDHGIPGVLGRGRRGLGSISGMTIGMIDPEFEWRNAPHIVLLDLHMKDEKISGTTRFVSYLGLNEVIYHSSFDISFWTEFKKREKNGRF